VSSSISFPLRSALFGASAWVLAVCILAPGWAVVLFLLAPLVLVPLSLALITAADRNIRYPERWRIVLWIQLPAALLLIGAFALPAGAWAALLTVPWFLVTSSIALAGVVHLVLLVRAARSASKGQAFGADACMYIGMAYLASGGGWALLSRAGIRPLDFSDIIVLATAVHFHYAGFVLPLLVGLAGRALPGPMTRLAAVGVAIGVPLVAVGITLSALGARLPELLAAWFLSGVCLVVAVLQLRLAVRCTFWVPRWFFIGSGSALIVGMAFAASYALSSFFGTGWLDIADMLPLHGAVNAFGFALCGLLAFVFQVWPKSDRQARWLAGSPASILRTDCHQSGLRNDPTPLLTLLRNPAR
jgi:hypothetical protein